MRIYKNPFLFEHQWSENECGDPFIMRFNGSYYLYCSSAGNHIKAWKSENLIDFVYLGSVCDEPEIEGAYAPEVCYCQGKFYMVTSPVGSGHYLLESGRPEGPFRLISKNYGLLIDGSFFIDDDGGQYFLRAGHKGIITHRMTARNEIDVNGTTIPETYLNYWTEGPMIIKRKGIYYLTYTGNHLLSRGYRIAYSVSEKSPEEGYVNLRDNTLLLETGDEFHALGHSSSFLAPDLDSYCIAYHNINLDIVPRKRSTNIDRIFFNGARMYCNPIWWEQEASSLPDYYGRGKEELETVTIGAEQYLALRAETPDAYTVEINANTGGRDLVLLYGYKAGENCVTSDEAGTSHETVEHSVSKDICGCGETGLCAGDTYGHGESSLYAEGTHGHDERGLCVGSTYGYGEIHLCAGGTYEIRECGRETVKGSINSSVSFQGLLTVRLAKDIGGTMEIYLNNMLLTSYSTCTGQGSLCIGEEGVREVGFYGISHTVGGRGDKTAAKAIPGRMDAIHALEEVESRPVTESGFQTEAAVFKRNKKLVYHVNIKEDASYRLITRISSAVREVCLTVSCQGREIPLTFTLPGRKDANGFEKAEAGILRLTGGIQELEISSRDEALIDCFIFEKAAEVRDIHVIKAGVLTAEAMDKIRIYGHKRFKSMLTKYSGFTCAENFGRAFAGESGWGAYTVEAAIYRNNAPTGEVSVYVMASRESWYPDQVEASLFGYKVKVDHEGIYLYRCCYKEEQIGFYACPSREAEILKLSVAAAKGVLKLAAEGEVILTYTDTDGFLSGKAGLEAKGEGFAFEEFTVYGVS